MRLAACVLIGLLGGCTAGSISQNPGVIECSGKTVISIVGGVGPSAGLNGSVTADCGEHAMIKWGPQ